MGGLPLAFSLHEVVSSAGADLGFAALIGLAILILLFFSQARETAALRRRADELTRRVAALEARLARSPSAPSGELSGSAPAKVTAAAAGTAERSAPVTGTAAAPVTGTAAPTAAPPRAGPVATNGGAVGRRTAVPVGPSARQAARDRSTGRGAGARARPNVASPQADRPPLPGTVRAWRLGLLGLGVLVAAVVGAAVVLLSGSGTHRPAASAARPVSPTAVPTVAPSTVNVAVLNGTPTPGLANGVALRLRHDGYAKGPVTDAADQTRTVTTVAYMPGHRLAALSVARALGLKPASVGPIDSGTRAVACGGATACTVTVVVTVGSRYPSR